LLLDAAALFTGCALPIVEPTASRTEG